MVRESQNPPHDLAAEQGVLGGILVHGDEVMAAVAGVLEYEDFYNRHHAAVYLAMHQLWDRGQPVDEITVSGYLRDQGTLNNMGGPAFLAELADSVIGPAHVEHYAKMVRTKAELRQIAAAAAQAREMALNPATDPNDALAEAERLLLASRDRAVRGQMVNIGQVLPQAFEDFEQRRKLGRDPHALPTSFKELDRLLSGGMRPGDLVIGAGRTSMGKTSFGLSVALNVGVHMGKTVLIVSREQMSAQLAGMMLCSWSQVSTQAWRSGKVTQEGLANLKYGGRKLEQAPIYFYHQSSDMNKMRTHARLLKARQDLALLVFDHIQRFAKRSTAEEIGAISRNLKDLAMDLGIPVLALSQVNREVTKQGSPKPYLEALKGSGSLEEDADVVLLFFRPGYYDKTADQTLTMVQVAKQRGGPTGKVSLCFRQEFVRFEDMEADHGLFD